MKAGIDRHADGIRVPGLIENSELIDNSGLIENSKPIGNSELNGNPEMVRGRSVRRGYWSSTGVGGSGGNVPPFWRALRTAALTSSTRAGVMCLDNKLRVVLNMSSIL